MSFFTFSGNKLAMAVLAAGALAVGGTGVAAMAESSPDTPSVLAGTESPEPSPTAPETESPEASPTETETEAPEPAPTETETEAPEPVPAETAEPEPTQTAAPVGPDAFGPAAFGLCNAFTNGGLGTTSTAYKALVQAAGGEDAVGAYCSTVAAPQGRDEDGSDAPAASGQAQVQRQQVQEQRQGASAANSGGHHAAAGNGAKQGGGQR
ncbi:outer membrane biosynthesis protein TonB [Pseudarthrobacter defluvii]|uniref:hypothetical protein n=1 Tax=Pseudarthrobacter defluvii TaxID=410837 RepID=UPI002789936B|nr:hypothetical protein [Pseudarthrobacter defluvii]MDQ0770390.1 outer membrane biosynthesis protein TonB [Pseudarthrobacter defluvii]